MSREICVFPDCMMGGGSCDSERRGHCDAPKPAPKAQEKKCPVCCVPGRMEGETTRHFVSHHFAEIAALKAQLQTANKALEEWKHKAESLLNQNSELLFDIHRKDKALDKIAGALEIVGNTRRFTLADCVAFALRALGKE